jgi:hypothetical protein
VIDAEDRNHDQIQTMLYSHSSRKINDKKEKFYNRDLGKV